jgi:hypothetical protein
MSLADNDVAKEAQHIADGFLNGTSHAAFSHYDSDLVATDPEAAADRVAEHWINAPKSLIFACVYLVAALNTFTNSPEKLNVFLTRLVVGRVLSENDILARWKVNGKLAMLRKIGRHADTLLQPSFLCLLPAHYSIIYQICLLIEEIGADRAELELSTRSDPTRDDVIKVRVASKPRDTESEPIPPLPSVEETGAQLFALRLTARDLRIFANDYVQIDTLDRCFRRPQPADNAGLVAIIPILMLGTFERALMPLLGFDAPDKLFLESGVDQPEITNRDVVVVARRGSFRPQPLTAFPADLSLHDVLTLAAMFFPNGTVKCQLFAQKRVEGWLTFIDDENWHERPSVR